MIEIGASDVATRKVLSWLLSSRVGKVRPDLSDGSIELSYSRQYRMAMIFMFLLANGLLALAIPFWGDLPKFLLVSGIFGVLWAALLYCVYDAFLRSIRVSGEGITRVGVLTRKVLDWTPIQKVSYSSLGNWYTFRSADGWSIRVSIYRNGLGSLAELAARYLPQSPARSLPPSFSRHAGNFLG
jgi:hypothetical protein